MILRIVQIAVSQSGRSQAEIAACIGMREDTLSRFLNGDTSMTSGLLDKLFGELNINVEPDAIAGERDSLQSARSRSHVKWQLERKSGRCNSIRRGLQLAVLSTSKSTNQIAREACVNPRQLSHLLNAKQTVRHDTLERLFDTLGVTLEILPYEGGQADVWRNG